MKKKVSMNNWKEIVGSPIWWVPVSLLVLFISIEGLHLAEHGKNCKTKAAWMNEVGLEYDRESEVQ